MPTDKTPPQPQAQQAPQTGVKGGEQQPYDDPSHWAYPEQVFAGESGDPIWEPQSGRRAPGTAAEAAFDHRVPKVVPEEKVPGGRLIDLVHAPPPSPRSRA